MAVMSIAHVKHLASTARPLNCAILADMSSVKVLADELVIATTMYKAGYGVSVLMPLHQKDVRLRPVDAIVRPTSALLYTEAAPFFFREQSPLGYILRHVLRQDHVPVLKSLVVAVLL